MKKSLYSAMFIASFIGLMCLLFTPMYKFNDELIKKNNTEVIAMWLETDASWLYEYRDSYSYNQLSDELKEEYDLAFYRYNKFAYAIWNEEKEAFFEINGYEVINNLYVEIDGVGCFDKDEDGNLIIPTQEEINLAEKILKNKLGEDGYNTLKNQEVDKEIKYYKDSLIKVMKENMGFSTDEEVEAYLIKEAKFKIGDEFLLLFVGYDQYLIDSKIEEISRRGIAFKDLFTTWRQAYRINKTIWQRSSYQELGFFDRCKAVINDYQFYNPLPLLLLTIVLAYIFVSLILLLFKSLKGIRGIKYPHAFINSIINITLCLILLLLPTVFSSDYHMSFHHTEYARFLNMLKFGHFSTSIIICLVVFHISLGISIFGRFFKWGKKSIKTDKN